MTLSNGPKNETNGDGRDTQGKFVKGRRGGPGRPSGKIAIEVWRRLSTRLSRNRILPSLSGDWVEEARSGEKWAITELLDRCVGNPTERETQKCWTN